MSVTNHNNSGRGLPGPILGIKILPPGRRLSAMPTDGVLRWHVIGFVTVPLDHKHTHKHACIHIHKLCVAYNNVFRKITFLPRDSSASLMFATRDLPTCKILIRKHAYIFMKSVA